VSEFVDAGKPRRACLKPSPGYVEVQYQALAQGFPGGLNEVTQTLARLTNR
jgi:hypothetical protein